MITRAHSVAFGISAKILPSLGAVCGFKLKFFPFGNILTHDAKQDLDFPVREYYI